MSEQNLKAGAPDANPVTFIRKVGRGKTLSQDLGYAEAGRAFALLLQGRFTPAQAGAFLQALPRATGAAAFLVFAAAGRLVFDFSGRALTAFEDRSFEDRSTLSLALASDARALRWTSANRI
jgi:hypothetical protein